MPRNELDRAVLDILSRKHDAVSVERICGGGYLDELTAAIAEIHGVEAPDLSPQEIIEKGEAGDALCRDVCQIRADAIIPALPIWRWSAARAVALSSPAVWRGICQNS